MSLIYNPAMFAKKSRKWYYVVNKHSAPFIQYRFNAERLPNTSVVTFRRLVWGTNDDKAAAPVLVDPFTVMVGKEVVFRLTTKRWIVKITANILMSDD